MPLVLAQSTTNLSLQQIIQKLGPASPDPKYMVFNVILYIIFFLALIGMFMQSDKQTFPTILMAATAGFAVISKLHVFDDKHLAVLIMNAGMFIAPFITAGITQAKKSIPLAIFAGIVAALYFFIFWVVFQRN